MNKEILKTANGDVEIEYVREGGYNYGRRGTSIMPHRTRMFELADGRVLAIDSDDPVLRETDAQYALAHYFSK